jgi:hypothetical protein
MSSLVAAAIKEQTTVRIPYNRGFDKFKILKVENATPIPGKITWHTDTNRSITVSACLRVDIVALP